MHLLAAVVLLSLATTPIAGQAKPDPVVAPNVPAARQGGDTIAEAIPIDNPTTFTDTGTTTGYGDNYDEACPYQNSTSPDVVYSYHYGTVYDVWLVVDLCGSSFDTKVYVYDEDLNLLGCNDDYYVGEPCGTYVSRLEIYGVPGNETCYIVVDGYAGDHGDYELTVTGQTLPAILCPPGGLEEGEPPLVDDYVDVFNGGCDSADLGAPVQAVGAQTDNGQAVFCGVSGGFASGGVPVADSDWLAMTMGPSGAIAIQADADGPASLAEMFPADCGTTVVMQEIDFGPFYPQDLVTTTHVPGEVVWLRVRAPADFAPLSFDYLLRISGLMPAVPAEGRTWGAVKVLFR